MSTVQFKIENRVGYLEINRPEALNALNAQVLQELEEILVTIEKKFPSELRCLVITGAGEKSFVAGADIKEMQGLSPEQAEQFSRKGQSVFSLIENFPSPVIAQVNGFALGGGLELALSCDFIFASDKARFGLPEVGLGLLPGFAGTVRLARVAGLNVARELVLTGQMYSAEQALSLGIVNRVLLSGELVAFVKAQAELIASRAPIALSLAKKAILTGYDLPNSEAQEFEANLFGKLFRTRDVKIGTEAFVNKTKAQFVGE